MAERPDSSSGMKLEHGSKPSDLFLQVFGARSLDMFLGDYTITMEDFAYMVEYIFTNTEVSSTYDIRIFIQKYINSLVLKEVEGGLRQFVVPDNGQMRDLLKERQRLMEA